VFDFGEDVPWGPLPRWADGKEHVFSVKSCMLIESLRPPQRSDFSFEKLLVSYTGAIEALEWYQLKQKEGVGLLPAKVLKRGSGRHFRLWGLKLRTMRAAREIILEMSQESVGECQPLPTPLQSAYQGL